VFNPEFRELPAPPPFNWTFGSAGGLAHPADGGQLDVAYFGRDEAVLAHQLLLLAPGRYEIEMQVSGDVRSSSGIAWKLQCSGAKDSLLTLPVTRLSSGLLRAGFIVPQHCPAQDLRLAGAPGDFPRTIEFSIRRFRVTKVKKS
jgi:hypothetical protein